MRAATLYQQAAARNIATLQALEPDHRRPRPPCAAARP